MFRSGCLRFIISLWLLWVTYTYSLWPPKKL
ncbi:hypothetical protein CPL00172_CDS0070 [Escherichia phage BubbaBully]